MWSDIPGRAAYLWIYDDFVATAPKGAVVVEVGVALGKSVAYLVDRLEAAGRDDVVVYGVDAWGGYAQNGEQQAMAKHAGGDFSLYVKMMASHCPRALERVRVVRYDSAGAARLFDEVDLLVLDADHTYEAVRGELLAWTLRVRCGGAIGGDDWMPEYPGVERAVREWVVRNASQVAPDIELRHVHGWGTWRVKL